MDSLPTTDIPTTALVVEKPGAPFLLEDVILDEIRSQELLVEIKYTGVCHTDLVVQEGKMPIGSFPAVLGHEGAGVILRLGDGLKESGLVVGDRVLLGYCSCMACPACNENRKGACNNIAMINFAGARGPEDSPLRLTNGKSIRGAFFGQSSFSKLALVDSRAVVKYDGPVDDLSFLAPLGCGYMTGAATVMNVLQPKASQSVAIFGLGAVGLCALMAAKSIGVREIIAVDILDSRLEIATKLGAARTINGKQHDSIETAIHQLLPAGVDYIVDTTGLTKMINEGLKALGHGGTFAVVGTPRPGELAHFDPLDMLVHCKKIIGVTGGYCNPQSFIPQLVQMFRAGRFPIDTLSETYAPSEIEQAIQDMKSGKVIKPILSW
ncbi:hypothetical protein PV08_11978 [Exophiala spinifera]|uniref:Enoyl reductase (ER) domain-containing protein n=1 Tax=Exophiala spinifera TaxID=91928 RepID=A0A0D1ZA26_9EURO|nr:uncharacterized protein PV08_11978 [Exophiala spinifera]KIW09877.1 hypothetical protein PV08_11978 [Exophiala spinifera]